MFADLNDQHYDLIIRQLDGSISREEEEELRRWLEDSSANSEAFDSIKSIWTGAEEASLFEKIDLDADWDHVNRLVNKGALQIPRQSSSKVIGIQRIFGIAAGFALILLSYFAYVNMQTEPGIREIALSDGSKVWLNNEATLDYPTSFSGAERTVTLNGEAFFDIAKNAEMPFVIKTPESKITVLGTSFNVRSDQKSTEVVVATGKVELSDSDNEGNTVILTPGLRGFHQGDQITSGNNPNNNFLAWKTGTFSFDGTPVDQALSEISAVSDKPARLDSGVISDCPLKASFENEKTKSMLETIALSCGLVLKEYDNAFILVSPAE